MKKHGVFTIVFCLFLLFASQAMAELHVSGSYSTNQHWTIADSPIIFDGDVTILNGATLTIDPNVEVIMSSRDLILGSSSSSTGNLNATGTTFTGTSGYIYFTSYGSGSISDCTFDGVYVQTYTSDLTLTNNTFSDVSYGLKIFPSGVPTLSGNDFTGCTYPGIYAEGTVSSSDWSLPNYGHTYYFYQITIKNNKTMTIADGCQVIFTEGSYRYIQVGYSSTSPGTFNVSDVTFAGTSDYITFTNYGSSSISDCTLDGVYFIIDGSSPSIQNNTISNNNIGIKVQNQGNPVINQNDIIDNYQYGVENTGSNIINCENNYWGSTTGPYHPSQNPMGLGNAVSDNVDFIPWSTGEWSPADFNQDGRVDGFDLAILAVSFGYELGDPQYNPVTDLNSSGRVDGFNLAIFCTYYGEGCFINSIGGISLNKPVRLDDDVLYELLGSDGSINYSEYSQAYLSMEFESEIIRVDDTLKVRITLENAVDAFGIAFDLTFNPNAFNVVGIEDLGLFSGDGVPAISLNKIDNESGQAIIGIVRQSSNAGGINCDGEILEINLIAEETVQNAELGFSNVALFAPDGFTNYPIICSGVETSIEDVLPTKFTLMQNYPNPFNSSTTIAYQIPKGENTHVILTIYNILGEEVAVLVDAHKEPGLYRTTWNGKSKLGGICTSGLYFYRIHAGDFFETKKLIIMK